MISPNLASPVRGTCLALAVGAAGAAVGSMLGLPAAALIGSCLVVSAAAGAGVPVALPARLRDIAFVIIGVSLGAGVEADILAQARDWTVSLVMLAAALVATVAVGAAILRRGFGYDAETAVLSSSPGTMSYAVAVALEGRGDATIVTTLQLVRLLIIVTTVPLLVGALGLVETHAPSPQTMEARRRGGDGGNGTCARIRSGLRRSPPLCTDRDPARTHFGRSGRPRTERHKVACHPPRRAEAEAHPRA